MESEEGKKLTIAANMNELAYTELILSIDDKISSRKVAFKFVKGCKNKDYVDGNASMAWERLKNKFEPSSAPSLVKIEIKFRHCSLNKGQDPEICITELEDYRMKVEELESSISDNQFILHILNNMTDVYVLQLAMMEKRVTDKSNLLTIDEIWDDLSLRFERLNEKQKEENENDNNQEKAFFGGQFLKENVVIVMQSGIKQRIVNQKRTKMAVRKEEITTIFRKIRVTALIVLIVVNQVILRAIVIYNRV
jgi:hypothetical protein